MQITITMADDGQLTVEADGREPYACESAQECLDYVEGLLLGDDAAEEAGEGEEPDMAAMWDEEAAARAEKARAMP